MLRPCFYHPRVTCMKWKNLYVTRVTSGRLWPSATSARQAIAAAITTSAKGQGEIRASLW